MDYFEEPKDADYPIVSAESGLDWVTLIADGPRKTDALVSVLDELARVEGAAGAPVKPFRFMGYVGQQCGRARLGFRGLNAVAQVSGDLCHSSWTALQESGGRVTRLDVQTTLKFSGSRPTFAQHLLSPSTRTTRRSHQHLPRTSYSSDTSGLCIGTVGRRTDRRYLRVYDKGIEKKTDPAGVKWRIELEAKQDLAGELWGMLPTQPRVEDWCYATCEAHWKSSGLCWPLPSSPVMQGCSRAPEKAPAPAAVLAAWLRTSVAPTIPRVLAMYSVTELLELLGISHLATPITGGSDSADS
jgi:hypothetical protein